MAANRRPTFRCPDPQQTGTIPKGATNPLRPFGFPAVPPFGAMIHPRHDDLPKQLANPARLSQTSAAWRSLTTRKSSTHRPGTSSTGPKRPTPRTPPPCRLPTNAASTTACAANSTTAIPLASPPKIAPSAASPAATTPAPAAPSSTSTAAASSWAACTATMTSAPRSAHANRPARRLRRLPPQPRTPPPRRL